MRALIEWLPKERGGRNLPPPGPKYFGVAKFQNDADTWSEQAWSIEIEFSNKELYNKHEGVVKFLVSDAPHHLLEKGVKFELFEGANPIASIQVL
jgi:hypothetical protein